MTERARHTPLFGLEEERVRHGALFALGLELLGGFGFVDLLVLGFGWSGLREYGGRVPAAMIYVLCASAVVGGIIIVAAHVRAVGHVLFIGLSSVLLGFTGYFVSIFGPAGLACLIPGLPMVFYYVTCALLARTRRPIPPQPEAM